MPTASRLTRVFFLAISSWIFEITCTAPNPPASAEERAKYATEDTNPNGVKMPGTHASDPRPLKIAFHSLNVLELLAICASNTNLRSFISSLPVRDAGKQLLLSLGSTNLRVSRVSVVGLALMCVGVWLRVTCYKRLAKNFTFELSLRKDHQLITDGPYAVVRHPSYSAFGLVILGGFLLHLGPGSLWAEGGISGYGKLLLAPYMFMLGSFYPVIAVRSRVEDTVLKAHFKDEWVRWSQHTPYRMIPWVY